MFTVLGSYYSMVDPGAECGSLPTPQGLPGAHYNIIML